VNTLKDEKKLLRYTYLLCMAIFFNLSLLKVKGNIDIEAIIMGVTIILLLAYAFFVVRRFFPDGDKYILIFASVLAIIGIGMLYRLDLIFLNKNYAIKQVIWFSLGLGLFVMLIVMLPDLKSFSKYKMFYLIGTIILMAMATFIGKTINGSKNWVYIGSFGFQPSEFGKLFLTAYLAAALKDYKDYKVSGDIQEIKPSSKLEKVIYDKASESKFINWIYYKLLKFRSLLEPAIVVMISLGFMVLQKDLGSALIFFGISVTMLYIATSKLKYIFTCLCLFAIGGTISYKLFDHVRLRVMVWLNPWEYAYNESHQIVQSLMAISSGGLFGSGLGQGYPTMVPVVESDFIFAGICEEFGIIIGFGIIMIFFLLFYRCIRAALNTEDNFSRLLAVGYSAMIASQVLVIIGGVVNAIPLTGITLPLVSYGGTSMLTVFFALGIIQKISEEQ
jgi:cell division protein FtsW (lipid II flippase)